MRLLTAFGDNLHSLKYEWIPFLKDWIVRGSNCFQSTDVFPKPYIRAGIRLALSATLLPARKVFSIILSTDDWSSWSFFQSKFNKINPWRQESTAKIEKTGFRLRRKIKLSVNTSWACTERSVHFHPIFPKLSKIDVSQYIREACLKSLIPVYDITNRLLS